MPLLSAATLGARPCAAARPLARRAVLVMAAQPSSSGTARIVVQGRSLEVTPSIREYVESKVNRAIHNFEGAVKEVDVKLSVRGNARGRSTDAHHQRDQIAEVTLYTTRHGVVRVEDTEGDLYAAVDLVVDKLRRKLTRLKERAVARSTWPGRGGARGAPTAADALPAEPEDVLPPAAPAPPPPEIVREKVLLLGAPMSADDAAEALEQVGHDFYVFADAADGAVKVLYRRRSHGYGLLVPQKA